MAESGSRPQGQPYTIKHGDTLGAIARHHRVSALLLAHHNQIKHLDHIRAGRIIYIPSQQHHVNTAPSDFHQTSGGSRASSPLGSRPASLNKTSPIRTLSDAAPHQPATSAAAQPINGFDKLVVARAPHQQHYTYQQAMIDAVLPAAREAKVMYHVPISVTLAQAAMESHWGLKTRGGAMFGVKAGKHDKDVVAINTHEERGGKTDAEKDNFVAYATVRDAVMGYGRFLTINHRYHAAFAFTNDPFRFVDEVGKAGYASKREYSENIKTVMRTSHLTDYDQ